MDRIYKEYIKLSSSIIVWYVNNVNEKFFLLSLVFINIVPEPWTWNH